MKQIDHDFPEDFPNPLVCPVKGLGAHKFTRTTSGRSSHKASVCVHTCVCMHAHTHTPSCPSIDRERLCLKQFINEVGDKERKFYFFVKFRRSSGIISDIFLSL